MPWLCLPTLLISTVWVKKKKSFKKYFKPHLKIILWNIRTSWLSDYFNGHKNKELLSLSRPPSNVSFKFRRLFSQMVCMVSTWLCIPPNGGDKGNIIPNNWKSFNFGTQSRNLRTKNNHLVPILLVSLHILENSSWWPGLWFTGRVKGCRVDIDNPWVNRPEFLSFWISIQSAWKSSSTNSDHSAEKEYTSTKELIDCESEREGKKLYWP